MCQLHDDELRVHQNSSYLHRISYMGHFIMFSMITNIYNKKTNGPTLMELFTATGKLKKFFWQPEMFDVCTMGDTAHIYMIFKFLSHMHQHGCVDILHCCNDRAFRSARSCRRVVCVLCVKWMLYSNHRHTRVIFQHTKRLLPRSSHFSHYIHSHCLAAEMWTMMKNNLLGKKTFELFLLSVQVS